MFGRKFYIILIILGSAGQLLSQKFLQVFSEFDQPLPFVYVHQVPIEAPEDYHVVISDWSGKAKLKPIEHFRLIVSADGFYDFEDTLKYANIQSELKVQLQQQPAELAIVEVTGELGTGSAKEALHKVTVIDRQRIEDQAAVNVEDVLANETNIRIQQDQVLGSSMSMQGISGENVKILIDGVPVIGRLGGNIDLSQINLDQVERIEIIEGPLSVSYGTNAMAGTINIITKKDQDKTFQGNVSAYYESIGQYNADGQVGFKKGKIYTAISGGRNFFDGWSSNPGGRFQEWNPKEQYFGKFQVGDNFGKLQWRISSDIFDETIDNKGAPRAPLFVTAFDDVYRTLRVNNLATVKRSFKQKHVLNVTVGYNYFRRRKNTFFKDLRTLEQNLTTNAGDQDTSVFDLIMSRGTFDMNKGGKKLKGQLGYDFNRESSIGQRIEGNTQVIEDYALFGLLEWHPKKWLTIRPGARVAYNSMFNAPIIPSLNTKFQLDTNHVLKASVGRGFRAPSLKELFFYFVDINHNIVGNPDLKAEQGYNAQVNYQWDFWKKRKANLKFNVFYNQLENMISLAMVGPNARFTYINVGRFYSYGSQLDMRAQFKTLEVRLGGTLLATYNQLSAERDVEAFNYSPEARLNLRYFWKKPALTFAFFYKYNGRMLGYYLDEDDQVQNSYIQAFSMSDITVSRKFVNNRLRVQLGVKNIFNVRDIQAQGATGAHSSNTGTNPMAMGRTLMVQSSFKF